MRKFHINQERCNKTPCHWIVQQHRVSPCQNHVTCRPSPLLRHIYLQYGHTHRYRISLQITTPTSGHYYIEIRLIIAAISRQVHNICGTIAANYCSSAQNIVTNGILKQVTPYSLAVHFSCRSSFDSTSRRH